MGGMGGLFFLFGVFIFFILGMREVASANDLSFVRRQHAGWAGKTWAARQGAQDDLGLFCVFELA